MNETPFHERPCAAGCLTSYRARGRYGWIMIGATDDADAVRQARRSTAEPRDLARWDGTQYVLCAPISTGPNNCKLVEVPQPEPEDASDAEQDADLAIPWKRPA